MVLFLNLFAEGLIQLFYRMTSIITNERNPNPT